MTGSTARQRLNIVAVMAAMSLVVLDAGLVNVALPTIARSLGVSPANAILTVSAYQAALVIGLLPSAHIAEKTGYRSLFIGGLALFSAASILCGLAPSLPILIVARFLQGLGGAAIMALGIALLRFALGPDRLASAIGWNALNVAIFSAAGPIFGALILSVAPWPWLFFAKLPIIALALVTSMTLPEVEPTRRSLDYAGIILHASTAGLFLLAIGMAMAEPYLAILSGCAAIALAIILVLRERTRNAPIWPIDLLGLRTFRVSVAASICCFVAQSAGILALPFYIQLGLGFGPLSAGIVMACWPLTVAVTSTIANRLAKRFGSAPLCVASGSLLSLGLLFSALWPVQNSIAPFAVGAALSGLGFGLFQVPNNRTMFLCAPPERSAVAGGMQGSARLIGQTIGALLMGILMASASNIIAPRLGLGLGAVFAVGSALISVIELTVPMHDRQQFDRPQKPLITPGETA